ncbi:MAG TPA: DUF3187 family protein [Candidatus Polarisedimenticolia bacterium]|nr:DUF3187 family protein [Candidatus Polarisedimenticolia bacterium]
MRPRGTARARAAARPGGRRLLACLAFAAAVLPVRAAPEKSAALDPTFGDPIPMRGQMPIGFPFYDLPPASAFLLPRGGWRLDAGLAYENTHAVSKDLLRAFSDGQRHFLTQADLEAIAAGSKGETAYLVDGENLRLGLSGAWGLGHGLEIGAELPLYVHTGGFFDGTIENYHEQFGFGDAGRGAFERDQWFVTYADADGTLYAEGAPPGIRPGDLSVVLRGAFYRSPTGSSAVSGSFGVEFPTGNVDRIEGNGALDGVAGVEASWKYRRSSLHVGGRLGFFGGWDALPDLDIRPRRTAFAVYEHRAGDFSGWYAQVLFERGLFPHRVEGDLGDLTIEAALGYRRAVGTAGEFDAALLENLLPASNSPDIGLWLGWRWRPSIAP